MKYVVDDKKIERSNFYCFRQSGMARQLRC